VKLCRFLVDGSPVTAFYDPSRGVQLITLSDDDYFSGPIVTQDASWQPIPDQLLPPVPAPEKILCIGLNYRDHAIETGSEIPTLPVVFSKFNSALLGHGGQIALPAISKNVDYEAELVVVIGKSARNVSTDEAMDFVFGYTCGHDVSARDWQKGRPGGQWLLGKTFDTFAPVGPCVVTKDEISDPGNVRVRMHLNDETVQDSTTDQLIFDIPSLISHLSSFMTLKPGDLIFTGTPPGVGAARNPPVFLKHDDHCVVEIDGIGKLSNVCVSQPEK
jgi:2-keto-4-pentenoate hydratase/2-oxohepta-3-ene-1,7-dioic acid hydratase in catechol pathway